MTSPSHAFEAPRHRQLASTEGCLQLRTARRRAQAPRPHVPNTVRGRRATLTTRHTPAPVFTSSGWQYSPLSAGCCPLPQGLEDREAPSGQGMVDNPSFPTGDLPERAVGSPRTTTATAPSAELPQPEGSPQHLQRQGSMRNLGGRLMKSAPDQRTDTLSGGRSLRKQRSINRQMSLTLRRQEVCCCAFFQLPSPCAAPHVKGHLTPDAVGTC